MAGTIPLSMTQQFDVYGKPLKGGQLFIIQAGTVSTPQDAFQDLALGIKMPYPMTLDAAGRVPQFFLDNSVNAYVKVRLQDASGIVQLASDSVLVIGSAGGGGGGTPVDPNALVQMGNLIFRYGVGAFAGYVRLNNLTIGSATSGATERANADTQALFQYLWITDTTLAVSGGRGASAAVDWAANKQLTLPDFRGYAPTALDDMGNAPSGRLTTALWGNGVSSPIILGAANGFEGRTLTAAQCALPIHDHPVFLYDPTHSHVTPNTTQGGIFSSSGNNAGTPQYFQPGASMATDARATNITIGPAAGAGGAIGNKTGTASQAAAAHAAIGPRKLCTFYIKL